MGEFKNGMTLGEARTRLLKLIEEGESVCCPTCDQTAALYPRQIYSTNAKGLIRCYREAGVGKVFHLPTVVNSHGGDYAKPGLWGLIKEADKSRDDGGRAGYWYVTPKGERFVRGEIRIPKYAYVYNGTLMGFDGDLVTIQDCLGKKFNLRELLSA